MLVMKHHHFHICGGQIWTPLFRGKEKRIVLECSTGRVGFVTDMQLPDDGIVYETITDFQKWIAMHAAAAIQWD
ncbi:hypothetical protein ATCC53582_02441 [Novacetimonas hansenii]|nr:hypothetical protein CFR74_04310 [Novacetimonas hansenii]RFP02635.1 hypothetical protein BGC30_04425 [Novacetimonas hansenii]CUW48304.1 hypothetical protein ATCC53582_02441 [Novacetimonas hansenii]